MRISRRRHLRTAAAIAALSLLLAQLPSSAADGPWPGLPDHTGAGGIWLGNAQSGMAETAKAQQWVRTPWQLAAGWALSKTRKFPSDDPRYAGVIANVPVYLVAPSGAEHSYGLSAPFTVRTVAFGAIPVAATVQLVQNRAPDGFTEPIMVTQSTDNYRDLREEDPTASDQVHSDAILTGDITLRVIKLQVDGVELAFAGRCQTAEPGKLSLVGKGFARRSPEVDETRPWLTGNYTPWTGGHLTGNISVPAFSGCTVSSGEDLSGLLTASVSGSTNPVAMTVSSGGACTTRPTANSPQRPPPPGAATPNDPGANCNRDQFPPETNYPERPSP